MVLTEWEQQNIVIHLRRFSGETYCGQPYKVIEPDDEGMYLICPDCIRINEELVHAD